MNRFLVCAVWCLLLTSAAAQTPDPEVHQNLPPPDLCQGKNPLLEHFAILGVQIYQTPQPADDLCSKEWKKHGTCCHVEQAANVTDTRIAKFASSLNDMLSQVEMMEQSMQRFLELPLKSVNLKVPQKLKPIEFPIKLKPRMSLQDIKLTVLRIKAWLHSKSEKLVPEQQKCLDVLKKITLGSTCSICSGRSPVFFAGKQLKMGAQTCRAIVKECSHAWLDLVEIVEAIKGYSEVAKQLTTKLKLKNQKPSDTATLGGVSEIAREIKLERTLKLCGRDLNSCRYSHISALCENFVYVVHPSYIEQAKSTISNITKVVDVSKGELDRIGQMLEQNKRGLKKKMLRGLKGILDRIAGLEKIESNLFKLQSNIKRIQQNNLRVRFSNLVAFQKTIEIYNQHTKRALESIDKNLVKVYQKQYDLILKAFRLGEDTLEEFLPKLHAKEANLLKKYNPATKKLKSAQQNSNWAIGNLSSSKKRPKSAKALSIALAKANKQLAAAVAVRNLKAKPKPAASSRQPRLLWFTASSLKVFIPRVDPKPAESVRQVPANSTPHPNNMPSGGARVSILPVVHREISSPKTPVETSIQAPIPAPNGSGTPFVAASAPSLTSDFSVIRDAFCQDNCVSLAMQDSGP